MLPSKPLLCITYQDPFEPVVGHLVIDRLVSGIAAGGLRIRQDVTLAEVQELALNMTRKQAFAGLRVGGAKAGLAMDPESPTRPAVLRRFLTALKPLLMSCFSCGPDLNTTMSELEELGRSIGVPALKISVGRAFGLADADFLARYALFDSRASELGTVNELRGPAAVVACCDALSRALGGSLRGMRVAIQGAGNMGGPAARLLAQLGAVVVGWADDQKCLGAAEGLDVEELYARRTRGRLPWAAAWREPASILQVECDVLLLAAVSRAISPAEVGRMRCRGVVEAANLAIAPEVEQALVEAGIVVVPDFVASVGGSLSVEALYATRPTSGAGIVSHVMRRATGLASDLLTAGQHSETSLREIGEAQAADFLQQTARLSPSA